MKHRTFIILSLFFIFLIFPTMALAGGDITYGEAIYGYIDSSNWNDYYNFYGNEGDEIQVFMIRETGDLDGWLTLWQKQSDDSWDFLIADDDSGGDNMPMIIFTLPADGVYSIEATRYQDQSGNTSGGYTLYLEKIQSGANSSYPDADNDGISDETEQWAIDTFTPYFLYDEDEHDIIIDQSTYNFGEFYGVVYLYQVSPVDCSTWGVDNSYFAVYDAFSYKDSTPPTILLTVVATYSYDYAPMESVIPFDDEDDEFNHYGDTEAVRICLSDPENDDTYVVDFVHVVRHSHDHVYFKNSLYFDDWHPILYISEGKHAAFSNKDECESANPWYQDLVWDEDCAEGKYIIPQYRPNVGEYYYGKSMFISDFNLQNSFNLVSPSPYFFELSDIYNPFYDEAVWASNYNVSRHRDNKFCGTYDVADANNHHWIGPAELPYCGGSLHSKWWSPMLDNQY